MDGQITLFAAKLSHHFGVFLPLLRAMQVDVIIVGQGICGTLLSWFLHKEGRSFFVIDDAANNGASRVAAGVINPVTGRRYVTAWMADEVIRFAALTYREAGNYFQQDFLHPKSIIDFFPSPQMREAFLQRLSENDTYLHSFPDQNLFNSFFHYDFGCGEIRPAYTVHLPALLLAWQQKLAEWNCLQSAGFSVADLKVSVDAVHYNGITAQKIVFCEGAAGTGNPFFAPLPFSTNKGEALIISCNDLPQNYIYKRGMMLVPLPEDNFFWLGSNYQWEYEDAAPSEKFLTAATQLLHEWLKVPFRVEDHKAAIRPATLERRPFVGFHPQFPTVGILNGMGTKGASLAPFFANQLAQQIVYNFPLTPEASIQRFSRTLSNR